MAKDATKDVVVEVRDSLETACGKAEILFHEEKKQKLTLSKRFADALQEISDNCEKASSIFTNVVTCLAIKVAFPELDIRYHQEQIGAPFSFRNISERVVYPWLSQKEFSGAKSGWQTRTLERPKPYLMSYDENIAVLKTPFLTCFDEVQENNQNASEALVFLLLDQLKLRDGRKILIAKPTIDEIATILDYFDKHFNASYKGKGASRLPVLAIYAIYQVLMTELKRFEGKRLKLLERHSAADSQTKGAGDIEVRRTDDSIFEAVEIKHHISVASFNYADVAKKLLPHQIERYYWLTTSPDCQVSNEIQDKLREFKSRHGCQIIVNGIMHSLRYYLRLVGQPSVVLANYADLLMSDQDITHEHRVKWNEIVSPISS